MSEFNEAEAEPEKTITTYIYHLQLATTYRIERLLEGFVL